MAARDHPIKELENQLHEMIHKNISILTLTYRTSAEFKAKFKLGMFKKNNQPGSQQVLYFLLSIIDQEHIHERITCWPLMGIRMESKFRMEVMRFYSYLQETYDDFGLKTLLASHLITPGGYKFAKFILKLSDLALFVYLNQNGYADDILLRPKPGKDVDMNSDIMLKLKAATRVVKEDSAKLHEEHDSLCAEYESELETIDQKLLEFKTKIYEANNRHLSSDSSENSLKEVNEDELQCEIELRLTKLNGIFEKFKECAAVTKYLLSKDNILIYDKANPIASTAFSNAIESDDKLNLIKFFETFLKYVEGKLTEVRFLPANFIIPQTEALVKINVEQEQIHYDSQMLLVNIAKAQSDLVSDKISAILTDI